MNAEDRAIINVLWQIAKNLAIFPSGKQSRCFCCYQIFVSFIMLIYSAAYLHWIITIMYPRQNSIDVFTDILVWLISILELFSFQVFAICYSDGWRNLYQNLSVNQGEVAVGKIRIYLEIFALHSIFLTKAALDFWTWVPVIGISHFAFYVYGCFIDYCTLIYVFILIHINIVIKKKVCQISTTLKHSRNARNILTLYRNTIQLVDDFNMIFGYQLLLTIGQSFATMLQSLQGIFFFNRVDSSGNMRVLYWQIFYSTISFVLASDVVCYSLLLYYSRFKWQLW